MFTPEEKKLLEQYVTSAEDDVFVVKGLDGIVGSVYARYSRAKGGFREVFLNEFIKEGVVDPARAKSLIERVLVAYGDDSVGELEGTHVSFENASVIAVKEIEDRRIGGSPIEQSTRYVFYDQKIEGHWKYLRHPSLMETPFSKLYEETMDFIFETYVSLIEPMQTHFKNLYPLKSAAYDIDWDGSKESYADLSDEKDKKAFRLTYNMDIRTRSCDALRALLPLSTLTNVGIFGNGRFFQHLISTLFTSALPESRSIAEKAMAATSQVIAPYVRRAKRSDYLIVIRESMTKLGNQFSDATPEKPDSYPAVNLLEPCGLMDSTLAAALYPYSNRSLASLRKTVTAMPEDERHEILKRIVGLRKTRRDRPGRAFEEGYPLVFDLVTNFGVYKDLQRHRMTTQQRQLFTTEMGFDMPLPIKDAGLDLHVDQCVEKSKELFHTMSSYDPVLAQYAVLHGHFVRWTMGMNAREAFHLIELRTTPQGHPQYRLVSQRMHDEVMRMYPWIAKAIAFADHNSYESARGDSEARQRAKERKLNEGEL